MTKKVPQDFLPSNAPHDETLTMFECAAGHSIHHGDELVSVGQVRHCGSIDYIPADGQPRAWFEDSFGDCSGMGNSPI